MTDLNRFAEIIQAAEKSNLEIHSICADYFTKTNLLESAASRQKLEQLVNYGRKIRVKNLVIPFFDKNKLAGVEDLIVFLEKAALIIKQAKKSGLNICLETDLPAEDMSTAIKQTQSSAKVCYDLGNAVAFGFDPINEISTLKKLISLVHIKDRKRPNGPNVFIDDGDVDFQSAIKALKRINYQNGFTLETAIGKNPLRTAEIHYQKLKKILI